MSDNAEVVELLREIRDLQKAHFERYKEFTTSAERRAEEASERQKQLAAATAREREAAQQFRVESNQHLIESQKSMRSLMASRWLTTGIIILVLIAVLFPRMLEIIAILLHK
jgi:hypothetical protein